MVVRDLEGCFYDCFVVCGEGSVFVCWVMEVVFVFSEGIGCYVRGRSGGCAWFWGVMKVLGLVLFGELRLVGRGFKFGLGRGLVLVLFLGLENLCLIRLKYY